MKTLKYKILYRNGVEDEIVQTATEEELAKLNGTIFQGFEQDANGVLTFGSGTEGYFVRFEDIVRVSVEILK